MDFETEQPGMPCPLAILAGTMALMTRYADPNPGQSRAGEVEVHPLLAKKIASNLLFLQRHPALPEQFGRVMAQVHAQWANIVAVSEGQTPGFALGHCCPPVRH